MTNQKSIAESAYAYYRPNVDINEIEKALKKNQKIALKYYNTYATNNEIKNEKYKK